MSIPNSVIKLWAARIASKIAICSAMTYDLYQLSKTRGKDGTLKLGMSDEGRRQLAKKAGNSRKTVEDVFIESLVAAGSCRHHPSRMHNGLTARPSSWKRQPRPICKIPNIPKQHFSTKHSRRQTAALAVQDEVTRAEVHDLVNTYDSPSELWDKPEHAPRHLPLAPRLVIPPEQEDKPPYAPRVVLPPEDHDHEQDLKRLRRLLAYAPGRISHVKLWDTFQSLRAPRLRYIADDDIRKAFRHLSWVEFRTSEDAMPRYLALLDECIGEQIPVTTSEWNTAVAFAGRWIRHTTSQEVKGAVEMWMRMERHGTQADHSTFNILFDVAVKAGRFALADTIFNELKMRDMPLNRYFRTSMIYYAGMRGDGDGVRQAFRDLVNAGEIVDTAIMNCVILSLVRAGEPAAAEHVFGKMKKLFEEKFGTESPRSWREKKELGILLHRTAKRLRREKRQHESSFFGSQYSADDRKEEVQRASPIKPDARTYRILIQHHAYTSGDIDRIREMIEEMEKDGLHIHGSVYVHLFRGFWQHGGFSYTAWNRNTLESFWDRFLAAAAQRSSISASMDSVNEGPDQSEEDKAPYFTRSLAHAALRAFYKCAGKPKMLEVWAVIKTRWKEMDEDELVTVQALVDRLVREDSVYVV